MTCSFASLKKKKGGKRRIQTRLLRAQASGPLVVGGILVTKTGKKKSESRRLLVNFVVREGAGQRRRLSRRADDWQRGIPLRFNAEAKGGERRPRPHEGVEYLGFPPQRKKREKLFFCQI